MFTWISRTACILLLAGCVTTPFGGGNDRVALTASAVSVVGPSGFCLDPEATRDTGAAGFAIFGNCAGLTGSRLVRQPPAPAVLTAAVSEPSDAGGINATLSTLSEFFRSADGRQVLSRTGDADTVTVMQSFVAGDVFYLRATDRSPGVVPGVQDTYWRAYFDVGARIVTLSVLALDGEPTDEAAQLSILESFVMETITANADSATPVGAPVTEDVPAANGSEGGLLGGLFDRIRGPREG